MCLGWSINFSKKIVPSPKATCASFFASLNCCSKSAILRNTRIPRPPPPAAAFIIIGKPIRVASCCAMATLVKSILLSSIMGTCASMATFFAITLSPRLSITCGSGPTNTMPSSLQRWANFAFSLKKPYPGCIPSTSYNLAILIISSMSK